MWRLFSWGSRYQNVGAQIINPATVVALGEDLYAPYRHLIELTVGVPVLGGGGRWLYEQKL